MTKRIKKLKKPTPPAPPVEAEVAEAINVGSRDRLFSIAQSIATLRGFSPPDHELWALVDEQFLLPIPRSVARYHRRADESLCQALENDERFQDAVRIAKGEVF